MYFLGKSKKEFKEKLMGIYFDTKEKPDCNGCGVCALKCPKQAILMEEDAEGFLYPVINQALCINCSICRDICPNRPFCEEKEQDTYVAVNKNCEDKKRSSSGGGYYAAAKYVLENGGIVFGVKFDSDLHAVHSYAINLEQAKQFSGSKYVRSDLQDSYRKVKQFLEQGKLVLFTGTPCQCAGLSAYLGGDRPKLITMEIICHANPSPKVLKYYIKNLEHRKGKKVVNILFRSKETGWRNQVPVIVYDDGEKEEENSFFAAFVGELINRPSCYQCRFCGERRYSDITIGDFWGIEQVVPDMIDDDSGISLLNINSEKGRMFLNNIKDGLFLKPVDTKRAFSYNRHCNVKPHWKRMQFFKRIAEGRIHEKNIIHYLRRYVKIPLYRRILRKIKRRIIQKS